LKKYLLDTNICIYLLKGLYQLDKTIEKAGIENCFISEITVAEMKFGAENSTNPSKNRKVVESFQDKFTILPIFTALDCYAKEKSEIKKER
jgi:tRNA(fMet)-specific endonuclease VapC